ncbi:MAG TPA: class I SAM-dependent methyltransferase [Nitratifractor salsuginis]|uniref:Class I SAM-dependent methyltransferase n=1 Tax=Nitratifractor salsuginis TaxID=269261 RepID=A0A7V2WLS3_9BACT|nr:class I SAM-dependent methyltransferase [Nitratifractor salsuginis]
MSLPDLSDTPLSRIIPELERRLHSADTVAFLILDPDLCRGAYAGERLSLDEKRYLCRSWRSWNDLALELDCRLLTPERYDERRLLLRMEKLRHDRTFHREEREEKYDPRSTFARIRKNEEPAFYLPYFRALKRLRVENRERILALGPNRGDELEPIVSSGFQGEILGIDLNEAALREAKRRFGSLLRTCVHDLNRLEELPPERFDLILSIGTLQSPDIELKPFLMHLVQERLTPGGAILLGWPNARWRDGELLYGARPRHYPFSELSLVIKDLFWIKKYLQQHKFRVVITGREYLFLEATRIGMRNEE